jgi:hypothetical protein
LWITLDATPGVASVQRKRVLHTPKNYHNWSTDGARRDFKRPAWIQKCNLIGVLTTFWLGAAGGI